MEPTSAESRALLSLLLSPGLGQSLAGRLVELAGSAESALGLSVAQLASVRGISSDKAGSLRRAIDATLAAQAAEREVERVTNFGAWLVGIGEGGYPCLLRNIPDPPRLLWGRGELKEQDALSVGIVGSRKCTPYGREQAERFAAGLCAAGCCVVSGGAYGVDSAAHRAALRVSGRTIAVIGSGLARPYPSDHAELFEQVVGSGGCLLSELPMDTPPRAQQFPARNRIISGMSLGVLVIEAATRSGALITARVAAEEHHREVMAVPGRVDSPASVGCHELIRKGGAVLVTSVRDVLDQLGEAGSTLTAALPPEVGPRADGKPAGLFDAARSPVQSKLLEALDKPRTLDEVLAATGLDVGVANAELTMLELTGSVERRAGRFARRR